MLEPSSLPATDSDAAPWAVDPHDRGDPRDGIPDEIIHALKLRALRVFDLRTAAVIGAAGTEGRVRVRIDDGRWALSPFEASIVALMIRLDPAIAHADLYADAFCLAATQAENKVEAVYIGSRLNDAGVGG
jgi:hypothetical protein